MVRRLAAALILTSLGLPATPAWAASCTALQITSGACSVGGGTTGGGVDLWGDVSTGGTSGASGDGEPIECEVVVNDRCVGTSPPKDGTGPTSVHDIESFRPDPPRQSGEPSGWAIRAVPANFWSNAVTHVVSGDLLGNPAEVRFTPVSFRRHFGDGDSRVNREPGASWRDLRQPPWTRTPTSHEFSRAGTYVVRVIVGYSAEFRFGEQDWTPLAGLVTARANDLTVTVLASDTVLVDRDCRAVALGCGLVGF